LLYTDDDGDKLIDVKIGGVAVKEFDYDLAGRTTGTTTSAGTTTFTYDHESRAVTLTGPGMAQTNVYNGLDTRVGSTTNSVANTYLRNGAYVTASVIKDSNSTFTPGVSERRGTTTTFSHSGLKYLILGLQPIDQLPHHALGTTRKPHCPARTGQQPFSGQGKRL